MRGKGGHVYTEEQLEFMRTHIKHMTWKELAVKFNETFNTNLSRNAIAAKGRRCGIFTGRDGRFVKGQDAWNKGMKGLDLAGENGKKTQFKKGQKPLNYRPVGSERVNIDGYIEVKVADPDVWKPKHRVVWEKANGPVPDGHCLIFLDGNKQNTSLDNLQLISRNQLARMNQMGLIQEDAELTKIGLMIADIHCKIGERKRKHGQKSQ